MPFDGKTYERDTDKPRLLSALNAVREIMADGKWRSLRELHMDIMTRHNKHVSESGISARIRDLRKLKFGGFEVTSRRRNGKESLWEYRLDVNSEFPFKSKEK